MEASTDLTLGQHGGDGDGQAAGSGEAAGGRSGVAGAQLVVRPQDVDAFWLQRQLAQYYPDALTAQNMTKSVLEVLQAAKDARGCENKLVLLLDYDKFDLVKLLTKNWKTVLYCTRLGQAQSADDRAAIHREMAEDPKLRDLLRAVGGAAADAAPAAASAGTAPTPGAGKARRVARVTGDDSMDVDAAAAVATSKGAAPP